MNQEKTSKITFSEYLKLVSEEIKNNLHTRCGQAYWNIFEININKIFNNEDEGINQLKRLRGTKLDPYYEDNRIPFFLVEVSLLFLHEESNGNERIIILQPDDVFQKGDQYQNWFSETDFHWYEIPNSLVGRKVGNLDIHRRIINKNS